MVSSYTKSNLNWQNSQSSQKILIRFSPWLRRSRDCPLIQSISVTIQRYEDAAEEREYPVLGRDRCTRTSHAALDRLGESSASTPHDLGRNLRQGVEL